MKIQGAGRICLFNVNSDIDKELAKLQAEQIFKKMGLQKTEQKIIEGFDFPLIPKADDFYLFPWRHISACIVGAGSYKATDFSEGNVLKKSLSLLQGRPAYLNHNQVVNEEIGVVGETTWRNSYTNDDGIKIPGGIEAPFVIDGVLQPKLVRQLSSPVSPIDSASVTTIFMWEASHDFEHDGDFYWHLGEEIDGTIVRRVAKEMKSYEESSMVWMGADPFAKMLDDNGKIVNIDKAAAYSKNKFSKDPDLSKYDPRAKYYVVDCLDKEKLLHLSNSSIDFSKAKTQNDNTMDDKLIIFLASFFATTPENIKTGKFSVTDAEKIVTIDGFSKMKTDSQSFATVSTEKASLETKVTGLETEVASLKADKTKLEKTVSDNKVSVDSYAKIITDAKAEAKRIYGVFSKGKPEKTIEDEVEAEVSLEKINKKIEMWGGSAVGQFGGECNSCHSKDISFRSSKPEGEPTGDDKMDLTGLLSV